MSDFTDDQLRKALINAHRAGDTQTAQAIAQRLSAGRTQEYRSDRSLMEERWSNLGNTDKLFPPKEAETMSPSARFRAGLDKGLEDVAYGAAQLGAHLMPGANTQGIDNTIQQREEDYVRGGLSDYPAGAMTGQMVGSLAPGGIGAKVAGLTMPAWSPLLTMGVEGAVGGGLQGATMPVAGDNYAQEKGRQIGVGTGVGGGVSLGLGAGLKAAESAVNTGRRVANLPADLAGRQVEMNSPMALEGRRLAADSGVPLTPGQLSGSPTLKFLEQRARESVLSSSRVVEGDLIRANAFQQMVDGQAGNVNSASFANGLQGRVIGFVRDLAGKRSATGRAMYGEVDRLAQGAKVVQPRNLYDELNIIIQEAGTQEGGDVVKAAAQARAMLDTIDKQGGYTAQEALSRLQNYSGQSTGQVFDDVSRSYDSVLKRRVYSALMKDMDETAAQGGTLGDMVKSANASWRSYSQAIDSVEQSALGKMVGKDVASDFLNFNTVGPEAVMDRFMSLRPSQAEYVAKFMQQNMPDQVQGLRGSILKDSVDAAMQLPASGGAEATFNPTIWLRSLGLTGGDKGGEALLRLKHLFGGDGSEAWAKMSDSINIARRMADGYGKNFSGTSQGNQFYSLLKAFSGRLADVAKTTGSTAMEAMGLRRIADSMDPMSQGFGNLQRTRLIQAPRVVQRSPLGVGLTLPTPAIGWDEHQ